jgi:hypothetical protein
VSETRKAYYLTVTQEAIKKHVCLCCKSPDSREITLKIMFLFETQQNESTKATDTM